jgi:hypothetical protein
MGTSNRKSVNQTVVDTDRKFDFTVWGAGVPGRGVSTPTKAASSPLRRSRRFWRMRALRSAWTALALGRRTPASVYGLSASVSDQKVLVTPARRGILETGGGCSVATIAAVATAALRSASATAAGTPPMATVPPYSTPGSVQRMGTS